MKIRVMSDLHLEFGWKNTFQIPDIRDDTVLVLAGDITVWTTYPERLLKLLRTYHTMFKRIIFVPGNHEYYHHGEIEDIEDEMMDAFTEFPNVHYLNNQYMFFDDVVFIGSTLWTDLDNGNPVSVYQVVQGMNDWRHIRSQGSLIQPERWMYMNKISREFIQNGLDTFSEHKKVVVTHYLPSTKSVPEQYQRSPLNPAFVSPMDDVIMDGQPDLWIHGHTHDACDYHIGKTRVVANPRGYPGESTQFNPTFEVEV